jgi:hypothetical protein
MTSITITTIPTIPYGIPSPPRFPPPRVVGFSLYLLGREKGRDGYAPAQNGGATPRLPPSSKVTLSFLPGPQRSTIDGIVTRTVLPNVYSVAALITKYRLGIGSPSWVAAQRSRTFSGTFVTLPRFQLVYRRFRSEPPRTRTWNLEIKSPAEDVAEPCAALQNPLI